MSISSSRPPVERVVDGLADTAFRAVTWVHETGSTNADLLEAARNGAAHGTVAVADHQTEGRGRRGRTWVDDPEVALLVSVLLRPDGAIEPSWLVSAASIALAETVRSLGVDAWVKWPNDIVVPSDGTDEKLAGVLAESIVSRGRIEAVVVGVGCNVTPAAARGVEQATAIEIVAPQAVPVDRVELLVSFLHGFDRLLRQAAGPSAADVGLAERYRALSATIGRRVRVEMHDRVVVGLAEDVDGDGRLVVRDTDRRHVITAGDVVHLRPLGSAPIE